MLNTFSLCLAKHDEANFLQSVQFAAFLDDLLLRIRKRTFTEKEVRRIRNFLRVLKIVHVGLARIVGVV